MSQRIRVVVIDDAERKDLGRMLEIAETPATVGRREGSDLTLYDDSVSRVHCELCLRDGQAVIRDLDSSSGVLVNGERVQERLLQSGDYITLGAVRLKVVYEEPGANESQTGCFPRAPDGLTGALNKRVFLERLGETIAATPPGEVHLLAYRCRGLRDMNDVHGYPAGDLLLRVVADRAMQSLGDSRPLGRARGNRFVVLLAGAHADEVERVRERLEAAVEREPVVFEGESLDARIVCANVTCAEGDDAEVCLGRAAAALDEPTPAAPPPAHPDSAGPVARAAPGAALPKSVPSLSPRLVETLREAAARFTDPRTAPVCRLVDAAGLRERGAYDEALELALRGFSTEPYDGAHAHMPRDVGLAVSRYASSPDTNLLLDGWILGHAGTRLPVPNKAKDDGFMEVRDAGVLPDTVVLAYRRSEKIFWDGGEHCRSYDGRASYGFAIHFARRVTDWLSNEIGAAERGVACLVDLPLPAPGEAEDLSTLREICRAALRYRDAVNTLQNLPPPLVEGDATSLLTTLLANGAADRLLAALARAHDIARRDIETQNVLKRFPRQELATCGHALSGTLRHTDGERRQRASELRDAWIELLDLRYMTERGGEAARGRWKRGD